MPRGDRSITSASAGPFFVRASAHFTVGYGTSANRINNLQLHHGSFINNYTGFLFPKLAMFSNIALMVAILLWRPQGLYPVANR